MSMGSFVDEPVPPNTCCFEGITVSIIPAAGDTHTSDREVGAFATKSLSRIVSSIRSRGEHGLALSGRTLLCGRGAHDTALACGRRQRVCPSEVAFRRSLRVVPERHTGYSKVCAEQQIMQLSSRTRSMHDGTDDGVCPS